jgi:dinuclear metal center YbgI/SA1388 family protein
MKVKDITKTLEAWAPLNLQESYDNSGLILGDPEQEFDKVLITLDVTENVIREAIETKSQLVIAHHPFIFKGIKKINTQHWIDRCIRLAVKNDISIYAIHTNLDNVHTGVNRKIADKLGLINARILSPKSGTLNKLVTFIPLEQTETVLNAMYKAGAGNIGNYDHCSFRVTGKGSFRPNEKSNPHIGEANKDEFVEENRVEVIFPTERSNQVITALQSAHPYEEVAYYLSSLENSNQEIGSGMIGELEKEMNTNDFFQYLKEKMNLKIIRHTLPHQKSVRKIALCGGSGSFLLSAAIRQKADVFITGDFKYHDFFEADDQIIIADIGHYESEVFTKDLIYDELKKNFANIALRLSEVNTNPVHYI